MFEETPVNTFTNFCNNIMNEVPPTVPKNIFKTENIGWNDERLTRRIYTRKVGWFILTNEVKQILVDFLKGKKVLEVGSGTGYLAYHMKEGGVEDYTAVDKRETRYWDPETTRIFEGIQGDALEFIKPEVDVVIMAWPPYDDPFGEMVLNRMTPGQILIYQGESYRGCCGNDEMFDEIEERFKTLQVIEDKLDDEHIRFDGYYDHWNVYQCNRYKED